MEVMPVASQPIYQFYAELKDYKPLIWRRFQVAGNITLAQLGYVTMTLFEMKGTDISGFQGRSRQVSKSVAPARKS